MDPHTKSRLEELVLAGELDPAVEQRAHALGWRKPRPRAPKRPAGQGEAFRALGRGRA